LDKVFRILGEVSQNQDLFRISLNQDQVKTTALYDLSLSGYGNSIDDYRMKVRKKKAEPFLTLPIF
jgi:hypothetical protein